MEKQLKYEAALTMNFDVITGSRGVPFERMNKKTTYLLHQTP